MPQPVYIVTAHDFSARRSSKHSTYALKGAARSVRDYRDFIEGKAEMTVKELSSAERRKRAEDLHSYLRSLPHNETMILYYEGLVEKLSSFEKVLNKLQAFVRFLSKLTSEKYWQWMEKAFAGFKAAISSPQVDEMKTKEVEMPADFTPAFEMPANTKEQKKTKKRFKFF